MPNPYFQFKQFTVYHDRCAMKVTTDGCLFGAWCAEECKHSILDGQQFLDIGTGSGLLSLMVAQKNKVTIDAIEIDEEAADQATQNVMESPFKAAITISNSDILNWDKVGYDVIISNPPFYEKEIASAKQQRNIAHHSGGLLLTDLFSTIAEKLKDTGNFYLLLPYKRRADITKLLKQTGLYLEKEVIVYPSADHQPFRLLIKGSKQFSTPTSEALIIYTAEKQYASAFTKLLKDYYLYL